jgi:phosphoglycerate dehydrogenase-like enzyme
MDIILSLNVYRRLRLVFNLPEVLTEKTADLGFRLMLAAARHLLELINLMRPQTVFVHATHTQVVDEDALCHGEACDQETGCEISCY